MAVEFERKVTVTLRRQPDAVVNDLYQLSHTDWFEGRDDGVSMATLRPLIEREWKLRNDILVVPKIGPIIAPDLYEEGGGHYVPF